MKTPKISVIIPIYNTGNYLTETLMSIVNQTIFEDIEVLMIDDGSTDESMYIIEKFALKYDNFYAYHKKNEGQGIARNYGLSLAKGEYVHFLDSDDYIACDAYEKMYNLAISKDYDFVVGNTYKFSEYTCWEDILFKNSFYGLDKNTEFNSINENPKFLWDTLIWNKLFKKEFLEKNNIKFLNKKIFFEDMLFSFECYIKTNSFCYLNYYVYYWRVRKNLSSVTQQNKSYTNFADRLEIMSNIKNLIKFSDLKENTINLLYHKWLIHDFKMYLRILNQIPAEHHEELIDKILYLINDIPHDIKDKLPSYQRILYKIIEYSDMDSLLYFAPLDNQLKEGNFDFEISEKYKNLIDFKKDVLNEELIVEKTKIETANECILIGFDYKINYFSKKYPHQLEAMLVDGDDETYKLNIKNKQIMVPFNLIKNKSNCKILVICSCDEFKKESYLRCNKRESILINNYELEIGLGINRILNIIFKPINSNKVFIKNISFDDGVFLVEGNSDHKISMVIVENTITFEKLYYSVIFTKNDFNFKIPYFDLIKTPVKKWELKCSNLMELSNSFSFFNEYDEVLFINYRNKILINDNIYNKLEKLNQIYNKLNKQNKKLIKAQNKNEKLSDKNLNLINENKKLKNENNKLIKIINEYKSRKIVKLGDKFKF